MDYKELKAKRLDLERQILNLKVSEAHQKKCDERKSKYMIWRRGTLRIEYEHTTIDSAMTEAERIARFNPGSEVYVLKQVAVAKVPSSDVQWKKFDVDLTDDDEPDDDVPLPF